MGKKGYENGIGAMSAEEKMAASEKGYENGLGAMSAEERMVAYGNELGSMSAKARMVASEKGYKNGIGAMSAEEKMAASEKGYENGLGAMSAEARMAAYEKGLGAMAARKKGDKMGIAWEKNYVEFVLYDGMPERGTPLHNWQGLHLSNKPASLNAKIQEERVENKGSTIWSERRVQLSDCVEQKNCAKIGNAWEEKYSEFESYDGMPERGTPLDNWHHNQLKSNGAGSLNAKIQK
jgi:hypothetical protein